MNQENVRKMLIDIPTKFCRTMNRTFIHGIIKEHSGDVALHHFMILKLLNENERLYVTEIGECLSIPKPQMTASTDKLIALGYVERVPDRDDRRKINVSITKKGRALVERIGTQIGRRVEETLLLLSAREIEVLEKGLVVFEKFCTLCNEAEHGTRI